VRLPRRPSSRLEESNSLHGRNAILEQMYGLLDYMDYQLRYELILLHRRNSKIKDRDFGSYSELFDETQKMLPKMRKSS
jgi:hypothetical protein